MDELPNRPDDRVAGRSGRLTLIVSDHLRRVGFAHALLVAAITPIAVLACGFHLYLVGFSPSDLLFLLVAHLIGFCGIAVAMHRYFAHRAFIAGNGLRYLLAVLGMTAGQGTVLFWVSTHRQHHRFADHPGDPHTPHRGLGSRLKRIWNAHMGWMFSHTYANPMVFAKDILADRVLMRISALYPLWVLTGLALPALVGLLVFGGPAGALRGFIWGGLLRMATVHHATFAVNSLGHSFGSRRHDLRDQSRNIAWLAIPTLGDSWHNNHHARPQSARAGQQWWEVDLGYALIRVFEKLRLVSDVRR